MKADSVEESLERIAGAFERIAIVANELLALTELGMTEDGYVRDSNGGWKKENLSEG